MAEENKEDSNTETAAVPDRTSGPELSGSPAGSIETATNEATAANAAGLENGGTKRAHRSQKVGAVVSDKMQKTVVVRVDRLVRHMKYRRYVRRTSKFMAHDELGATVGDKVRIVETRPMSARKRWRVIEIVQKAAK
jgi:small subunit ribosomal protein S17